MTRKRYPVIIERTATGFSAYSPDVPGCAAVGDSEEETRRNLRDALAAHFGSRPTLESCARSAKRSRSPVR